MKCSICQEDREYGGAQITDNTGTKEYCLNCLVVLAIKNKLKFKNSPDLVDDVTGEKGAVKYESYGEVYILEKERMRRLIAHSLFPEEYFALAKKYGANQFELHSDFYDDSDGEAVQPLLPMF